MSPHSPGRFGHLPRAAFTVFAHLSFWGWGVLAVTTALVGLFPEVLADLFRASFRGLVTPGMAIAGLLLMVVPVAGMVVGGVFFRKDAGRLLSFFYGVQAPIVIVCLLRLFAFQELNDAVRWLGLAFVLGAPALFRVLWKGPRVDRRWGQGLLLVGQSAYLGVAGWLTGLVVLFTTPICLRLLFFETWRVHDGKDVIFLSFALLTASLLLAFPIAMFGVTVQGLRLVHQSSIERLGRKTANGLSIVTLVVFAFGVVHLSKQDFKSAWEVSEDPVAAIEAGPWVREALVDMHLWDRRYLMEANDLQVLDDLWDQAISGTGAWAVKLGGLWLRPVVYQGIGDCEDCSEWRRRSSAFDDPGQAAVRFHEVYDTPIDRAEGDRLRSALRNTWQWWNAEAGVLDVGQAHVWLESQEVTVEDRGGVGVVTVHDVLRNRTWNDREVVVYFTLPEGAVPTGLWLGDSPDRSEAFTHVVAPRGAAQQVYREQVRRSVDPAILEQVGPRQYRLKAFPILAREDDPLDVESIGSLGAAFHVWLEVTALPDSDGRGSWSWPVPEVSEVRGLAWNGDTVRTINGREVDGTVDRWVPHTGVRPAALRSVDARVALQDDGWDVSFAPRRTPVSPELDWEDTVVIVDTTRSMVDVQDALVDVLAELDDIRDLDLICAGPEGLSVCPRSSPARWTFAGRASLADMLSHAIDLPETLNAGHILVLTDHTTYDGATDARLQLDHLPPITTVHLDGLPVAFADAVQQALARGGGAHTNLEDAILGRAGHRAGPWQVTVTASAGDRSSGPALRALAAREVVAHMLEDSVDLADVDNLDQIHAIAVEADIVSPISSMLVLVNRQQRERLAQLSKGGDRFEREVESAQAQSGAFGLSSAPEPHEWLLMLVAAGLLLDGLRRRRRTGLGLA